MSRSGTGSGDRGEWWTGPERVAIAAEVRAASTCSLCASRRRPISSSGDGVHGGSQTLPPAAVEAIHRITTDPARLSAAWYGEVINGGLSEEEFVELVGVVAATVMVDTLAFGLARTVQ